jgi:hypothetical protein
MLAIIARQNVLSRERRERGTLVEVRLALTLVIAAGCGRVGFNVDTIGCADDTREAFVDVATAPGIAGCAATWPAAMSLRMPRTGAACGNTLGPCAAPADACGLGWHLCGVSGDISEIQVVGPSACLGAGTGRFVAAASHDLQNPPPCLYASAAQWPCVVLSGGGAEPICCGTQCILPQCPDGVWPGQTYSTSQPSNGCGNFNPDSADGVLCCTG